MEKRVEAAGLLPLCVLLTFLSIFVVGPLAAAPVDEDPDGQTATAESFLRNYVMETPENEEAYPLFRLHRERYYPELDTGKAAWLSAFMPGLGQAYAGDYKKATLFLTAELGTFALAGYNIARALHYNEQRVFETGFQDPRTDDFLTYDQGQTRMRNHIVFSGIFLAAGIGLHVWNILDAPQTAEAYNDRRFSVHVQHKGIGTGSLIFTHRF